MAIAETDHAWAAGFIDGEGCIYINRRRCKNRARYTLFVTAGQSGSSRPEVLDRLSELYGGRVYGPRLGRGDGRQPSWGWGVASAQAESCLRLIVPYLVGKRGQAVLALGYRESGMGVGRSHVADDYYRRIALLKRAA